MDSQDDSQESQDSVMTVMDDNRPEVLYFAYGSNLSTEQMRERCPYSTPVGLGFLPGWRWIINTRGYANVVPDNEDGSASTPTEDTAIPATTAATKSSFGGVYGLLYLLPLQDEERLDRYEGVPLAYEKAVMDAKWVCDGAGKPMLDEDAAEVRVLVHVDKQRTTEDQPKEEYVGRMERGIEDAVDNWGMDKEYADSVMRRFWRRIVF